MTDGLSASADEVAAQLPYRIMRSLAPLHGKSEDRIEHALNNDLACGDRACLIGLGIAKNIGSNQFLADVRLRRRGGTFGKDVIAACHQFLHTEEGRTRYDELKRQYEALRALGQPTTSALALL